MEIHQMLMKIVKFIIMKYKAYMKNSIKIFEDMGVKIKLSKNIYKNTW